LRTGWEKSVVGGDGGFALVRFAGGIVAVLILNNCKVICAGMG
jgi:hypothetical protein